MAKMVKMIKGRQDAMSKRKGEERGRNGDGDVEGWPDPMVCRVGSHHFRRRGGRTTETIGGSGAGKLRAGGLPGWLNGGK